MKNVRISTILLLFLLFSGQVSAQIIPDLPPKQTPKVNPAPEPKPKPAPKPNPTHTPKPTPKPAPRQESEIETMAFWHNLMKASESDAAQLLANHGYRLGREKRSEIIRDTVCGVKTEHTTYIYEKRHDDYVVFYRSTNTNCPNWIELHLDADTMTTLVSNITQKATEIRENDLSKVATYYKSAYKKEGRIYRYSGGSDIDHIVSTNVNQTSVSIVNLAGTYHYVTSHLDQTQDRCKKTISDVNTYRDMKSRFNKTQETITGLLESIDVQRQLKDGDYAYPSTKHNKYRRDPANDNKELHDLREKLVEAYNVNLCNKYRYYYTEADTAKKWNDSDTPNYCDTIINDNASRKYWAYGKYQKARIEKYISDAKKLKEYYATSGNYNEVFAAEVDSIARFVSRYLEEAIPQIMESEGGLNIIGIASSYIRFSYHRNEDTKKSKQFYFDIYTNVIEDPQETQNIQDRIKSRIEKKINQHITAIDINPATLPCKINTITITFPSMEWAKKEVTYNTQDRTFDKKGRVIEDEVALSYAKKVNDKYLGGMIPKDYAYTFLVYERSMDKKKKERKVGDLFLKEMRIGDDSATMTADMSQKINALAALIRQSNNKLCIQSQPLELVYDVIR